MQRKEMIPIARPVFDKEDMGIIQEPLRSGWVTQGNYVKEFEKLFGEFTGIRFNAASTSCTTALHLLTAAIGLKPGDEVIVPSFTWIATANCVEYMGAKPVFVDVRTDTFNIDVNQLERRITEKTRAIIPVHLFGLCADMDVILEIAGKNNIKVFEDAACAFDSWYKGKHAGSFGDASAFSFHPRKSITTGEGGMASTNNEELGELFKSLRDHGSKSDLARHNEEYSFLLSDFSNLGYNYRMTDIQGALGVSQMKKAKAIMASKRKAAEMYFDLLKEEEWLQLPYKHSDYIHGYQSFVCLYQPEKPELENLDRLCERRNKLMYEMELEGIMTRQGTHSIAHSNYYRNKYSLTEKDCPNSLIAEKCSIALPLFADMTEEEIHYIVKSLKNTFTKSVTYSN